MKNALFIFVLVAFSTILASAQGCFPNGLTFSNQTDLDLFPQLYPNCTIIEGDLTIMSSNITNVDSLYNITKIMGELDIYQANITNLAGLSSLDTVGHNIDISFCNELINLEGLNSLKNFGCYPDSCYGSTLRVNYCDKITSLSGLESLKDFTSLVMSNNPVLASLDGLDSVLSIGQLKIEQCDGIQSLSGIETVEEIDLFKVFYCDSITELTSMPNLKELEELDIRGNDMLESLDGLDSVAVIQPAMYGNARVRINNNCNLSDISGIGEADLSALYQFEIEENPMLGICTYSAICNYIDSGNDVVIRNNMPGCNGVVELVGLCCAQDTMWCPPMTKICFENGVEFGSQSDIDAFPGTYPNCTTIGGYLKITSNDIVNLDSLYNITKVLGELDIYQANITNLAGLSSLDTVGYNVDISFCNELINLEGLNSLKNFGCYPDSCYGSTLRVNYCDKITSLSGLESLKDFTSLVMSNNPVLASLDGLDSVQSIGQLKIEQCDGIQSLSGIETVEEIDLFKVFYCDSITELTSMPNLKELEELDIRGNDMLENLDGLDSVAVIQPAMYGNARVRINNNCNLSDISGIGEADLSALYQFEIEENPMLGICTYSAICNYIDSGNDVVIRNNMPGCNGVVELVGLCCAQDTMWCPPMTKICFENGVEFGSQSDIDAFPGTYPNCTTIGGYLKITSNDIVNLDSLYNITKVLGELDIYQANITNLAGLSSLDTVGYNVDISFCNELINLEGLNSLKNFGCYPDSCYGSTLRVNYCDKITSLSGLESLKDFTSLVLSNNPVLASLDGLDSVQSIGQLKIEQCDGIQSLSGIETVEEIDLFKVFYCDSITELTSMPNLKELEELDIRGNDMLENLDGLDSVAVIQPAMYGNARVRINNNGSLSDISGMGDADLSVIYELEIIGNPFLSVCAYPGICSYVENYENAVFGGNDIGCSGQLEVEKDCQGLLFVFEPEGSETNFQGGSNVFYWHDADNWRNNTVPTDSSYAIIPQGNECIIQQDSIAVCKDLILYPNAEIKCLSNSELQILGND